MRKAVIWIAVISSLELQWGRNLIVAEGRHPLAEMAAAIGLQWGRNLIVAEGGRTIARVSTVFRRFNGAAT